MAKESSVVYRRPGRAGPASLPLPVEFFSVRTIANAVVFRGGTALHKLHFAPAARYSEDLDLVQSEAEPIGELLEAIRRVMSPIPGNLAGNKRIPVALSTTGRVPNNHHLFQCA